MSIEIENLHFSYPNSTELFPDGLTFQIRRNCLTVLLGPNGCGKSTLLKLVCGIEKPISGNLQIDGNDLSEIPGRIRAQKVATVFQNQEYLPAFSVFEMTMLGRNPYLSRFGQVSGEDQDAVTDALKKMDLLHLADRSVTSLSGGERQRVAIAAALARKSDYLLLDEPTSAADPAHRISILRTLHSLHKGILLITHDITAVKQFSDSILMLKNGKIIADGLPADVLNKENIRRLYGEDAVMLL